VTATVVVATVLLGCRALTPSGFWKDYRSKAIVKQFSDQGPWGGERWILWENSSGEGFAEPDVRLFAERNGWRFLERVVVSDESIGDSSLFHQGDDRARRDFPEFISGESVVLKFDSRLMREDPGTNEMSTAFGYVQLSKDGGRMVVYHLWGNA